MVLKLTAKALEIGVGIGAQLGPCVNDLTLIEQSNTLGQPLPIGVTRDSGAAFGLHRPIGLE